MKYVDFGNHSDSCLGNISTCQDGITIALWVKLLSSGNAYIFYNGGGIRITMSRRPSEIRFKVNCQEYFGSRGKKYTVQNIVIPDRFAWLHVAVSCDINNNGRYFINGIEYDLSSEDNKISNTDRRVRLGSTNNIKMFIADELHVWTGLLSAKQVLEHYSGNQ